MAARSQLGAAARPLGVSFHGFPFLLSYNPHSLYVFVRGFLGGRRDSFRDYLYGRYVENDARDRYYYVINYLDVLSDPLVIQRLTPSQAHHLLNGLAALRDYIRVNGYIYESMALDYYLKELRKLAPRKKTKRVLDEEIDKSIIDKALEYVSRVVEGKWRVVVLVFFYTGLRSPEVVYMFQHYSSLRKIIHSDTVILELGYERASKKAWITMFPYKLEHRVTEYEGQVTENTIKNIRNKKKITLGLFRDAHLAILSDTMQRHEINLLQGRVSAIDVKHYTKHLRRIAEKYHEAYKKYNYLLD